MMISRNNSKDGIQLKFWLEVEFLQFRYASFRLTYIYEAFVPLQVK